MRGRGGGGDLSHPERDRRGHDGAAAQTAGPFLQQQLQPQLQQQQMAGTGGARRERPARREATRTQRYIVVAVGREDTPANFSTVPVPGRGRGDRGGRGGGGAATEGPGDVHGARETRAAAALPRYDNARANAAVARASRRRRSRIRHPYGACDGPRAVAAAA